MDLQGQEDHRWIINRYRILLIRMAVEVDSCAFGFVAHYVESRIYLIWSSHSYK